MKDQIAPLDDEPRAALGSYITNQLETEFRCWYGKASGRAYYSWLATWWTAVLAGFLTTAGGILVANDLLGGPWVKALLLILPALGSLAASLLPRFVETKALRERGRQVVQRLIAEARLAYADKGNDRPALVQYHEELIKRATSLEIQQLKGFVRVAQQGAISSTKG
jgi:hypothetical protein